MLQAYPWFMVLSVVGMASLHVLTTLAYLRFHRGEIRRRKLQNQRIRRLEKQVFGGDYDVEEN